MLVNIVSAKGRDSTYAPPLFYSLLFPGKLAISLIPISLQKFLVEIEGRLHIFTDSWIIR